MLDESTSQSTAEPWSFNSSAKPSIIPLINMLDRGSANTGPVISRFGHL
jgi:hypothetical protein